MIPEFKQTPPPRGVHPDSIALAADVFRVTASIWLDAWMLPILVQEDNGEFHLRMPDWSKKEKAEALFGDVANYIAGHDACSDLGMVKVYVLHFFVVLRCLSRAPNVKKNVACRNAAHRSLILLRSSLRFLQKAKALNMGEPEAELTKLNAKVMMNLARLHFVDVAREMDFPGKKGK